MIGFFKQVSLGCMESAQFIENVLVKSSNLNATDPSLHLEASKFFSRCWILETANDLCNQEICFFCCFYDNKLFSVKLIVVNLKSNRIIETVRFVTYIQLHNYVHLKSIHYQQIWIFVKTNNVLCQKTWRKITKTVLQASYV